MSTERPVLFSEERIGPRGLGLIQLNHPQALNALSLPMLQMIHQKLEEWRQSSSIAAVFVHSGLAKAFCAGGDVKALVSELMSGVAPDVAAHYFHWEYFVDDYIHSYPKPIIAWSSGYTLGGGWGLFQAASHRIVTETSVLSMPEISIGFFPDVGAGSFLHQLPDDFGLFMALTALRLNGEQFFELGMAQALMASQKKQEMIAALLRRPWSPSDRDNHELLSTWLNQLRPQLTPDAKLWSLISEFQKASHNRNFFELHEVLKRWDEQKRAWPSLNPFFEGSPFSARVIFDQYQRTRALSRRQCHVLDWNMALHFCEHSDFKEGVRARLIQKPQQAPHWMHSDPSEVPQSVVDAAFVPIKTEEELFLAPPAP